MARKRNPENDLVVTSGAAAPARRKSAARPKHSPTTAEMPVDREQATSVADGAEELTHDQIARLAYSYWLSRGCQGGCPEEDWARAEHELRQQASLVAV